MTRGAFNTTCDVYSGPGATPPNTFKGSFPCRLVLADAIYLENVSAPTRSGWVTLEGLIPQGPWTSPGVSFDPRLSDWIAVPAGSIPRFWNIYTDSVLWETQAIYYRANVAPLPLPMSAMFYLTGGGVGGGTVSPTHPGGYAVRGGGVGGGTVSPTHPGGYAVRGGGVGGGKVRPLDPIIAHLIGGGVGGGKVTPLDPIIAHLIGGGTGGGIATLAASVLPGNTCASAIVLTSGVPYTFYGGTGNDYWFSLNKPGHTCQNTGTNSGGAVTFSYSLRNGAGCPGLQSSSGTGATSFSFLNTSLTAFDFIHIFSLSANDNITVTLTQI